jgi:hypothetical protein
MSGSVDSEASKKDGALIRPGSDRAQGGDLPPFFTEEALLRLEEGLRAQREQQEGRRFSEPDAASPHSGSSDAWQACGADEPKIHAEECVPSPLAVIEITDECLRFAQNCERWAAEAKDSQVRNAFCIIAKSFAQLSRASRAVDARPRTDLLGLDAKVTASTRTS